MGDWHAEPLCNTGLETIAPEILAAAVRNASTLRRAKPPLRSYMAI
jgi:hypothetical protein